MSDRSEPRDSRGIPGIVGFLVGDQVLIVGVEDDPEPGLLRVYINARWKKTYVLVSDPDEQERVRHAWRGATGHITMARPPAEAVYVDE